jgi:hypothetical protein
MRHFIPRNEFVAGHEQTLGISKIDAKELDVLDQLSTYLLNAGDPRDVLMAIIEIHIDRIRQRAIFIQKGVDP